MVLDTELLVKFKNGEIALENDGTIDQLNEIISNAFPQYKGVDFVGSNKFYRGVPGGLDPTNDIPVEPILSVTDFYKKPKVMKLNQKLIQDLRDGKIVVKNTGTVEELKMILNQAFPEDKTGIAGKGAYYYRWMPNRWNCAPIASNRKAVNVEEFFKVNRTGTINDSQSRIKELEDKVKQLEGRLDKYEPKLPEINGYEGSLTTYENPAKRSYITYGCAILKADWFESSENRKITQIELDSGVVIGKEDIEKIREFVEENK